MSGRVVATAAAGVLFGAGLVVSGMTDPRKVIGFLDFTGNWNPQLIAVMAGAIAVYATLLALVGRAGAGAARLLPPRNNRIDRPLLLGAAIFGVGWGLSGYCPGPAIASLGFGARGAFVFVAAMVAGIIAAAALPAGRAGAAGGCESP
jgi:uncharacterized membrane protein YedE/YeeE